MKIPIIQIGNSRGIRLSKMLIEKYEFKDTVEVVMEQDCLIIKADPVPRKNWDSAFRAMHERGDDQLLIHDVFEDEPFE